MKKRTPISPQLRDWIVATTRAGHDVPGVLRLMKDAGYDARQSRHIVAEVLDNSAIALDVELRTPTGKRTHHPQPPEVEVDGHRLRVPISLDAPVVRVLEGLLSDQECDALIEQARPRLARAMTVDAAGRNQIDQRRTSEGMFFGLGETSLVSRIEQRLAILLDLPVEHGEGLQILHYRPGQQYEPHVDWFDPAQHGFAAVTASGGQRIASVVMYLNTPELGGGTQFPHAGLTVAALRGSAVYFAYEGGDQTSLHAGLPVISGEKWIATKWLRERPYH